MKSNRLLHILTLSFVGAFFLLQIGLQLSGKDIFSNDTENRAKAKFEGLSFHLHVIRDFEYFFRDHFALRDGLIHLSAVIDYLGFRASPVPKVIIGKEKWLYYNEDSNIESYRNADPYTADELEARVRFHESVANEFKKRGVQYIYVIAPNNQTIYPEFLPNWAQLKLSDVSHYDQLLHAFAKTGIVNTVDLRPALLAQKKIHRVFYNTNTHWNKLGGFIGYQSILSAVTTRSGDDRFAALRDEEVTITADPNPPGGDLLNMMGFSNDWFPETGALTVVPKVTRRTQLKVSMFHDSFFDAMQEYFFAQFTLPRAPDWKKFSTYDYDELARDSDLIVFEQVERSLYQTEFK